VTRFCKKKKEEEKTQVFLFCCSCPINRKRSEFKKKSKDLNMNQMQTCDLEWRTKVLKNCVPPQPMNWQIPVVDPLYPMLQKKRGLTFREKYYKNYDSSHKNKCNDMLSHLRKQSCPNRFVLGELVKGQNTVAHVPKGNERKLVTFDSVQGGETLQEWLNNTKNNFVSARLKVPEEFPALEALEKRVLKVQDTWIKAKMRLKIDYTWRDFKDALELSSKDDQNVKIVGIYEKNMYSIKKEVQGILQSWETDTEFKRLLLDVPQREREKIHQKLFLLYYQFQYPVKFKGITFARPITSLSQFFEQYLEFLLACWAASKEVLSYIAYWYFYPADLD
jgi:hypothetical protein